MTAIEEFVKEQACYGFGQPRRQIEIERFCLEFDYKNVLSQMPLNWAPVGCVEYTLKGFVHRWLSDQISELASKARVRGGG